MDALLQLLGRSGTAETHRTVHINESERNAQYPSNVVSNTKYNVFTFLPKNLYEQFSRFMNIYFLMIASLQLWSDVTPVNPISTWGPLIFIFALSALKEGLDDYKRYRRDKLANEKKVAYIRNGVHQKDGISQDIMVGDIIRLSANDEVPCDIVLLKSSDELGTCYIQTANIDGETDLKQRCALEETQILSEQQLGSFKGYIICSTPNAEVYRFDSQLFVHGIQDALSLSYKQMIPQATFIKNVEYIYGVVVYTGNETKLGKNKETPPTKWTKADRFINQITTVVFCLQLTIFVIMGSVGTVWKNENKDKHEYLKYDLNDSSLDVVVIPLRFLLLMSLMIPISLKVTLDICKYFYASLIMWDEEMYEKETETYAVASNTAISEDLGQIQYIFTDKTGTLTENIMKFKFCSTASIDQYQTPVFCNSDETESSLASPLSIGLVAQNEKLVNLFLALAACNSVIPEKKESGITYCASSPDEEELVQTAAKYGIVLEGRTNQSMDISISGFVRKYELLQTFDFNSDLKRMSVILRDSHTNTIHMFTKGADEAIFKLLSKDQIQFVDPARSVLNNFAEHGLRTLCVAHRIISSEEYDEWYPRFVLRNSQVEKRDEAVQESRFEIEKELHLDGVTAIEDKLQDGVAETIHSMREAGLVFWMLTGDKLSTALQIAKSCSLLHGNEKAVIISGQSQEEIRSILENQFDKRNTDMEGFGIVIDGTSLRFVLEDPELKSIFLQVCVSANAVICCRVTPKQKAEVVLLMKNVGCMTLAIGDGGNDVSMIQQAHVGVAILGREGKQATRAADYTISRFRFLKRLTFVHGHLSYYRTSFIGQYSFYKSLIIGFIQVSYGFLSAYSGTSFFNSFCLTTYNILFTGIPIFFYCLDRDKSIADLMSTPLYYTDSMQSRFMNRATFCGYFVRAVFQAGVVFMITILCFGHEWAHHTDGSPMDYESLSMIAFTSLIVIQTLTLAQETNHFTVMNHVIIWGTCLFYFFAIWIYNLISSLDTYTVMDRLYSDSSFWFGVMATSFLAIIPVAIFKNVKSNYEKTRNTRSLRDVQSQRKSHFHRHFLNIQYPAGLGLPYFSSCCAASQEHQSSSAVDDSSLELTSSDNSRPSRASPKSS